MSLNDAVDLALQAIVLGILLKVLRDVHRNGNNP